MEIRCVVTLGDLLIAPRSWLPGLQRGCHAHGRHARGHDVGLLQRYWPFQLVCRLATGALAV